MPTKSVTWISHIANGFLIHDAREEKDYFASTPEEAVMIVQDILRREEDQG